jgi:Rad3-related DNA helicase
MCMQTVVLTSGTLSPIDLYPKLLDFMPVTCRSLQMTLTRECLCPVVLTRGADQMPVSSKYESRKDKNVLRCVFSDSKSFSSAGCCFLVHFRSTVHPWLQVLIIRSQMNQ